MLFYLQYLHIVSIFWYSAIKVTHQQSHGRCALPRMQLGNKPEMAIYARAAMTWNEGVVSDGSNDTACLGSNGRRSFRRCGVTVKSALEFALDGQGEWILFHHLFLGMVSDWPELPIGQVSLIPLPPPGGLAHPGTNHRDHRDHSTFGPRPDFFGVERPTGQAVGREITAITGITALFETGLQFWGGQGPEGWGGRKSHRPGQFQPVGVLTSESSSWLLPNREGTSLPCRYVLSHPTYS
jgi:hypothetical protein